MIFNERNVKVLADFYEVPGEAVLYTEQELTPEQQEQARSNIGVRNPLINLIDTANLDPTLALTDVAIGQYVLNGFFTYNGNTEEGVQFNHTLVQIFNDPIMNERAVCYFNGANYICIVVGDNYFEKKHVPLTLMESIYNRAVTIDENSDNEHYPTAKAVYDYVGQNGGSASAPDHSMYFDIDIDGLVSLKPKYRGATNPTYVSPYPASESDRGAGNEGSEIHELPERLVIPNNVDGEMVTGFQKGAFCCNHRIKEVVLPSGVKDISNGLFREAIHLEKVENTEQIESIGNGGLQNTRIEEIHFPNLITMGNNAFSNCSCLRLIDIGKVTSIGNKVFVECDNLAVVLGGENVRTIGVQAFRATRRLKSLSFLPNVTKIDGYAFYSSRCDFEEVYPTLVQNGCNIGQDATYKQFNATEYWSGASFTACKNPLNTLFNQLDPRWADEQVGDLVKDDGTPIKYGRNACAFFVLAEIYSAFENKPLASPQEFAQILEQKSLLLNFMKKSNWVAIAQGLGYETTVIYPMTAQGMQTIYDALAEGALVYRSIATFDDTAGATLNGGHAVLAYGVNSEGELLTANTTSRCFNLGIYESHKDAWHIYQHGNEECYAIIVRKKKEG